MAITQFLYTRPSDNLLASAVLAVNTGTVDAEYPAAYLADLFPDRPAKLTTTFGSWTADLGSAKRADLVAIIHNNFDAALPVRLQGHTSNSWATPDINQLFTIPARHPDQMSINVWLDLKTLIPVEANRTRRWWRLFVDSATPNSQPLAVGEWRLEQTRRDLGNRNISWGSRRSWIRPAIIHDTELLVRRAYDLGTTLRTIQVDIIATDAVLAEIDAWFRDALGVVKPFVIVPASDENEAWLVTFENPERPYVRQTRNANVITLEFRELSRGLYL